MSFLSKKRFLQLIDIVFQEIKNESCYIHVTFMEASENLNKTKQKQQKELGVKKGMGRGRVISPRIFSRAQAMWRSTGI